VSPDRRASNKGKPAPKKASTWRASTKLSTPTSLGPSRARSGLAALRKKFTLHVGSPGKAADDGGSGAANEGEATGSATSSEEAACAFDLSLELDELTELNAEAVEEDSLGHLSSLDGPATFHGSKHRALMAADSQRARPECGDGGSESGPSSMRNFFRNGTRRRIF
jgi:hypothetical protein